MPVPSLDQVLDPLLRFLDKHSDGVPSAVAYEHIADHFRLSPEDLRMRSSGSAQPSYQKITGWAQVYLKRAGLTSSPQRGLWSISDLGSQFLKKHSGPLTLADIEFAPVAMDAGVQDPTPRVQRLESATGGVESVGPDVSLLVATTLMSLRDYSQLPVMPGKREVKGVVSWKSIGKALSAGRPLGLVRDFMTAPPPIVGLDQPLFDVLSQVVEHEMVLVRGEQNLITGLITMSDVIPKYREMAEPFLLLESIENHIRRILAGRVSKADFESLGRKGEGERQNNLLSDLTMGEYVMLFQSDARWNRLGIAADRAVFARELDEIRKIRNDVMHFDPEQDEFLLDTLRSFEQFLRDVWAHRRVETDPPSARKRTAKA